MAGSLFTSAKILIPSATARDWPWRRPYSLKGGNRFGNNRLDSRRIVSDIKPLYTRHAPRGSDSHMVDGCPPGVTASAPARDVPAGVVAMMATLSVYGSIGHPRNEVPLL
jgi:hypothetical protein